MSNSNTKSYSSYERSGYKNKFYTSPYTPIVVTVFFAGGVGAWLLKNHYDEVKAKEAARIARGKWRLPDYIVDGYKHDDPDIPFDTGDGIVLSPNNEMAPMVQEWYSCKNLPSPLSSVSACSPVFCKIEELLGVHHKPDEVSSTIQVGSADLTQTSSLLANSVDISTLVAGSVPIDNIDVTDLGSGAVTEERETATEITGDVNSHNNELSGEASLMGNNKVIESIDSFVENT